MATLTLGLISIKKFISWISIPDQSKFIFSIERLLWENTDLRGVYLFIFSTTKKRRKIYLLCSEDLNNVGSQVCLIFGWDLDDICDIRGHTKDEI